MLYIIEINLICLFILLFILSCIWGKDRRLSMLLFGWCIIASAVCVSSDILWQIVENGKGGWTAYKPLLDYIINTFYYSFDVTAAFFWFMYAEVTMDENQDNRKRLFYFAGIPLVINVLLCLVSLKTGIYFRINEEGHYERGTLFFINTICCYLYTFAASIHALFKSFTTPLFL